MKKINFSEVSSSGKMLPAGGYICKITSVEDMPNYECLKIEFDIADGEYKGYAQEGFNKLGFWGLSTLKSYKPKALGYFKQFLECLEKSNKNFSADSFDCDEMKLVGKFIGFTVGYEEYYNSKGEIKTRAIVVDVLDAKSVKEGKYNIPELKKVAKASAPMTTEEPEEEDFPF